jgi:hypothetical protein
MEDEKFTNQEMIKMNIFKQRTYRELYSFRDAHGNLSPSIQKGIAEVSNDVVFVSDLEMPLFAIGEKLYIKELDKGTAIVDRMRSSDNSVCYQIESKTVQDDVTFASKQKAEEELKLCKLENKLYEMQEELMRYRSFYTRVQDSFFCKLFLGSRNELM